MTVYTVQLVGLSYAAQGNIRLCVEYNNFKVYDGPIPITHQQVLPKQSAEPQDGRPLAEWQISELVTGHVPLQITVYADHATSGIKFSEIRMNGTNCQLVSVFNQAGDLVTDFQEGNEHNYFATPQFDIQRDQFLYDRWGGDGKSECKLNGKLLSLRPKNITQFRHRMTGVLRGSWHYTVPADSVFECCYHVDPLQFKSINEHRAFVDSIRVNRGVRSWAERHFDISGPPLWIERRWPQIDTSGSCDFSNYTYLPLT